MTKGDAVFAGMAALALIGGTIIGFQLQPKQPKFPGDSGYQEQAANYRAGGSKCEPAEIQALAARLRERQSDACAQAEEEHREATENLVASRRAAIAAEAGASYTAIQARIEAWGAALGLLTLLAATAAAVFAKKAADHTETGAQAARTANEIARADTRPILAFAGIGWERFNDESASHLAHFQWRNVGKRPLRLLRLDIGRVTTPQQPREKRDWLALLAEFEPLQSDTLGLVVMPDGDHISTGNMVTARHFQGDHPGDEAPRWVYLLARAIYVNAISGEHAGEFTTSLSVQILPLIIHERPRNYPSDREWDDSPKALQLGALSSCPVGYQMGSVNDANAIKMT